MWGLSARDGHSDPVTLGPRYGVIPCSGFFVRSESGAGFGGNVRCCLRLFIVRMLVGCDNGRVLTLSGIEE